jgi:hypothetical protein
MREQMKNHSVSTEFNGKVDSRQNGYPGLNERIPLEVAGYIASVLPDLPAGDICWVRSGDISEVEHRRGGCRGLVNLHRINDILHLNPFLEQISERLPYGAYLIVCLETKNQRKQRLLDKYPAGFNWIYYTLDFVLKRVFPKWKPTRKIYFRITGGRNRVMTCTEAMGRLVCCGYSIIDSQRIGYRTFLITQKTGEPTYDRQFVPGDDALSPPAARGAPLSALRHLADPRAPAGE